MTTNFRSIGLLYHALKPQAGELAERVSRYLEARGLSTWIADALDEHELVAKAAELDLMITFGGDGTILRAARAGSRHRVPVLGVKLGRVGFLAEVQPETWQQPLEHVLTGEYWLEERMLLQAQVLPQGETVAAPDRVYRALNDVVVSRGGLARLVTVDTSVDGALVASYRADGVIVATPTGCTGYALAAGGPVLAPELRNLLIIPICPHLNSNRPIVLAPESRVTLRAHAEYPAIVTVDGQFEVTLAEDDRVEVSAAPEPAYFVRAGDRSYFFRTLTSRLRCID